MTFLNEKIKRKMKLSNFKMTKIIKFEIHLKKKRRKLKFHKL